MHSIAAGCTRHLCNHMSVTAAYKSSIDCSQVLASGQEYGLTMQSYILMYYILLKSVDWMTETKKTLSMCCI